MAEPMEPLRRAFQPVRPVWTPERAEASLQQVHRKLRRARRRRASALASVAVIAVAITAGAFVHRSPSRPESPLARVRLHDGSLVQALEPSTSIEEVEMSAARRLVRLRRGAARFDVVPAAGRPFRVDAGLLSIEVLGTSFTVEPRGDGRQRVAVLHGRVRVAWAAGSRTLEPGEAGFFPPEASAVVGPMPERSSRPPPTTVLPAAREPSVGSGARPWRALARQGRFHEAYRALGRDAHDADDFSPEALLLAADVARFSGHPTDALRPLRLFLARHPHDPRASLAAFTLGRILLDQLGRPLEAAAAFGRSLALDPGGELAEDALAREAEAWATAGDAPRARQRASEYLRLYPAGRRARAVRSYGMTE